MTDQANIQTRLVGIVIGGMESSNDDDDKTPITRDELDKILIDNNLPIDIKVGLESLSRSQVLALVEVLKQYGDVFAVDKNNPGSVDPSVASHSINTEDAKPVHQGPRRVSPAQRLIIKDTINALLKAGIIRPSRSPCSSPVLQSSRIAKNENVISVQHLGHLISKDGFKTNPEKIGLIAIWGTPFTLANLHSFLSLDAI
jgi:hypothetical protein